MLITEKIKIKIINKNIEHFNNIGYNVKYGDIVEVFTKDLMKSSKYKIKVVCDICGKEKKIQYNSYFKQHEKQDFDTCQKCKTVKRKKTMLEKYGVEHALQNKKFMKKAKNTMLEKYGAENSANSIEIQEKNKKTIREKYGVEYITQSKEFKDTSKKTKKEKYGNEYYNNHNQIKETKKEIYNNENFNNREKSNETCLEKYGVENVSQSDIIKNKKKQTSFKNYGLEHPLKTFEVMEKLRNTSRWTKIEDREDFYKYYLLVCKYTLKNKKELINNWNGNDYYTNEFILENFNLNSNDKNYPTIDHKNSIKYGFDNNITAEELSKINNLCITTRSNNSSKGEKIETEFNI